MAHGSEWLCDYLACFEAETAREMCRYTPSSTRMRWRLRTAMEMREYLVHRGQAELDAEMEPEPPREEPEEVEVLRERDCQGPVTCPRCGRRRMLITVGGYSCQFRCKCGQVTRVDP